MPKTRAARSLTVYIYDTTDKYSYLHHRQTEQSEWLRQLCIYCHLHLREYEHVTFDPNINTALTQRLFHVLTKHHVAIFST